MVPEVLSVLLKTIALIAALQSTGGAMFLELFRRQMSGSTVLVAQDAPALCGKRLLCFALFYSRRASLCPATRPFTPSAACPHVWCSTC